MYAKPPSTISSLFLGQLLPTFTLTKNLSFSSLGEKIRVQHISVDKEYLTLLYHHHSTETNMNNFEHFIKEDI